MKGDRLYNENTGNLLIRGAYGELNRAEELELAQLLENDEFLLSKYNELKLTANTVSNIGNKSPSENFEYNLYSKIGINPEPKSGIINDLLSLIVFKPYRFAAGFGVIFIILFASFFTDLRIQDREYSQNEIIAANKEASQALKYVGDLFNQTSEEFAHDILKSRVARPLKKGIGIVNSILNNGDKNEKNNL